MTKYKVTLGTTYAIPSYGRKPDQFVERIFEDEPTALKFLEYSVETRGYSWGNFEPIREAGDA